MVERALRNLMVVGLQIVLERRLQLGRCSKSRLVHYFADSAVEALHHAVGLWVPWWAQTVFNVQRLATHIKVVSPRWLTFFAGEAVCELAAIVREQLDDFHRSRLLESVQKIDAAGLALIGVDPHEHPAACAIDGPEQIAPLALVGHLRQILNVHVQEARLVVLEGLDGWLDLSGISKGLGHEVREGWPRRGGAGIGPVLSVRRAG